MDTDLIDLQLAEVRLFARPSAANGLDSAPEQSVTVSNRFLHAETTHDD